MRKRERDQPESTELKGKIHWKIILAMNPTRPSQTNWRISFSEIYQLRFISHEDV